jgi:hypothetical protein
MRKTGSDALDQNQQNLPRAPRGWPMHSVCDSCKRALSRTQVYCSCGWEQRPPVIHILNEIDARMCDRDPLHNPDVSPENWAVGNFWVPIDRSDADPLPDCAECLDRLRVRAVEHDPSDGPFAGRELVRVLDRLNRS